MTEQRALDSFAPIVDRFTAAARTALAEALAQIPGLAADEASLFRDTADQALRTSAQLKLNRVLLLELHAAKRGGELTADDDAGRFAQFVERALRPDFIDHLDRRYPPLRQRLARALEQQRNAIAMLAVRFAADRDVLQPLLGQPAGRLRALALGQGDLHAGGQTVARLSLDGGPLIYKPRSLRIDAELDRFLAGVFGSAADRVRVPAVMDRGEYGWAAFAVHRYCANEDELRTFYAGLGHWLAVLRLIGGTDIHLENLIAVGPVPVVIDVESVFAPAPPLPASGYGDAYDAAMTLIGNSVLRTGIVPFRAPILGFEGVDMSAAGALPNQQPQVLMPAITGEGTTDARLEVIHVDVDSAQNHPTADPDVSRYWDCISAGFVEASARLRELDGRGELGGMLARFEGCAVRDIRRPTMAYVEIGRMLWHPASLHDEAKAIERARDLFARNAALVPIAPSDPAVIRAEIDDLRHGDVPIFVAPLARAQIDAVYADWRAMRIDLEELTIRSALVATDLNQHMHARAEERSGYRYGAQRPHADALDARRRTLAADAVRTLLRLAVRGDDGTTTWITPEITDTGWLVRPVQPDVYFGLGGIAVALAGYRHEVAHARADAVDGIDIALDGALKGLRTMTALDAPAGAGGLSGWGAQIWTWVTLHDALARPGLLDDAVASAEALGRHGFAEENGFDLLNGVGGAIVPLLGLAHASGDARWLALAARAAQRLEDAAIVDERGARWPSLEFDEPIGGFAHGATGIAWALTRLVLAGAGSDDDRRRWTALADAAFAFQENLYDAAAGNWRDMHLRGNDESFPTWCHGCVGIGLAAGDLYARTGHPDRLRDLRRAVANTRGRWGLSHTLCHGDLSSRELLVRAAAWDAAGCASDVAEPTMQIVSAIEEHRGMVGGLTRAAFTPGLMIGVAGAVHSLNRMHPDCTLASPLLLERMVAA